MKEKIIYIAPSLASFTRNDIHMLSRHFEVVVNVYNWKRKGLIGFNLLAQAFFLLGNLFRARAVIVSSGGYWSLLPALFGKVFSKKVFIILNGADCASFPELGYGSLRNPVIRFFCGASYRMASCLLPVSDSLRFTANTFYHPGEEVLQGYKHFFPGIHTPSKVIYNGLDTEYWKPVESLEREKNTFISVFTNEQFILKGGDLILEMASQFPSCTFILAGCDKPAGAPDMDNVIFPGRVGQDDLKKLYSHARFHFQLSIFEGFGYSLCEAMLCECVPIGSSVNMIPEIIGDSGFILQKRNAGDLESLIRQALSAKNIEQLGREARITVMEKFNQDKREQKLLELIHKQVRI